MTYRFERIHRAYYKQYEKYKGQHNIDEPQSLGRLRDTGTQLVVCNTRHLRVKHLHATRMIEHRDYSQGKKNYTHAAYPLHQATPHDNTVAEMTDRIHDRRPGSGESRHSLKKGIGDRHRLLLHEYEWNHAENRKENPYQSRQQEPLSFTHAGITRTDAEGHYSSGHSSDHHCQQKTHPVGFVIDKGCSKRDCQEKSLDDKKQPDDTEYHREIYGCRSVTKKIHVI